MKRVFSALLVAMLVACSGPQAGRSRAQPTQEFAGDSKQNPMAMTETITGSTPDGPISATARLRRYDARKDGKASRCWLGTDGGKPSLVLADLSLVVGGQPVAIPSSLYADFGDVAWRSQFLAFSSGGDRLFLRYIGGDAAGYFYADFVVRGLQLEEVRIHTQTFQPGVRFREEVRTAPSH